MSDDDVVDLRPIGPKHMGEGSQIGVFLRDSNVYLSDFWRKLWKT